MDKLSSHQAGTLGELLTVAKLNTIGLAAYMSPEGAPGHDVMVVVDGQPRSIEVKTRQFLKRPTEITRWPVDMQTKGDADFFVFIELDLRTMSPTFYLLTNAQARETFRDYMGGGNCYPQPSGNLFNRTISRRLPRLRPLPKTLRGKRVSSPRQPSPVP